jgi:hypothetical protein
VLAERGADVLTYSDRPDVEERAIALADAASKCTSRALALYGLLSTNGVHMLAPVLDIDGGKDAN